MQIKESKTNWHFWISFAKSCIRILAAIAIIGQSFVTAGLLLLIAEVFGIVEEL